jgi:hypothetical protein
MHSAFSRMSERLLSHYGQESLLRGEVVDPPRKIAVRQGVQLSGYGSEQAMYRGDMVTERDLAYVPKSYAPAAGNTLQHPDGNYRLDVRIKDDGNTETWVLLPGLTD